jgi:hypothetical protein
MSLRVSHIPANKEDELKSLLTNSAFSFTAGYTGGVSYSYAPGAGTAFGVGIMSPQVGVSANFFSERWGNMGVGW